MTGPARNVVRVQLPWWFRVFMVGMTLGLLAVLVLGLVVVPKDRLTPSRVVLGLVFLTLIAGFVFTLPLLLSAYVANEAGFTRIGPVGHRTFVAWSDVVSVSPYRVGVIRGLIDIVSRRNDRIAVSRGMPRVDELIDAIRSYAPRAVIEIRTEVRPNATWRSFALTVVIGVAIYLVLRTIYKYLAY